ncbi:MAG: cytochrome o ubiquinol oxidase subunit III [Alphaproteobacteria bacterium 65-37]|jgi:cytochrome o ubiquinol oxidase subunit 3|nr:cytochrome o ubiquinol oxidase subunit III [Alphaproteobacteria bacterium]OJU34439.1 MAG: cytochrome o ubiquinol oxidase subunit III [Alphaproteobacteria bacterium 65-37]
MSVMHLSEHEREELETREQRALGFWLYLMGDAVIFALLFATYAIMIPGTAGGPTGKQLFNLNNAALETALLLVSSLTFGFASLSVQAGNRKAVLGWLGVTFVLGAGFIFLELREFAGLIAQGAGPDRSGFLSAFFTLVGTHGVHVSMGLLWIVILGAQVAVKGLTAPVASRLFRLGLFWHFLDIAWVGIFSIVYLPGLL